MNDAITTEAVAPSDDQKAPLDFSDSPTLKAMLLERCQLAGVARSAQQRIIAIDAVLRVLLGSAESAVAGGFEIRNQLVHRRQCVIPAGDFRRLIIRPTSEG